MICRRFLSLASTTNGSGSILEYVGLGALRPDSATGDDPATFSIKELLKPPTTMATILPRQLVAKLPPSYLETLRRYLDGAGLQSCDEELIAQAFIHPGWDRAATMPLRWKGLAFAGDALLDFLVSSYFLQRSENHSERSMHMARFAMLNNEALARTMQGLPGLVDFVLVHHPRAALGPIFATCLEAFVGAVYLGGGLDAAGRFFSRRLLPALHRHRNQDEILDPISHLQSLSQRLHRCVPQYRTLQAIPIGSGVVAFTIGVFVTGRCLERAQARSVQEGRKLAALRFLQRIGGGDEHTIDLIAAAAPDRCRYAGSASIDKVS